MPTAISNPTNSVVAPPAEAAAAPPRRVRLVWLLAATILAALLFGGSFVAARLPRLQQREALVVQARELAVPTVTVVSPAAGQAAGGLLLQAEVKPWLETPIYARANGYLKRWLVDLGARVEAGQVLGEIETPELDQELERARHELAQAEAALALAKTIAKRSAQLVDSGGVSRDVYDQDQAGVTLKSAAADAARAGVRRLEELRAFAQLTAPFAGTITARQTDVGDLIAAGSGKELFRLAQTDRLRVRVRVPQTQALAIEPGQMAELLVPELPGRRFPATVGRTAGAISADSRTLLVELDVDNCGGELLAGSFAQVRFAGTQDTATLTLPSNTLLFRAAGPQVGVVLADGTVQLRSVTLGRDFGKTIEILAGVSPTDRVILNPSDALADGASVRLEGRQ
jgi:RND family efflux transporter MFP subunit